MILRNKKTREYGKFMMCHDDDRYPFYIETTGGIRIYYSNFEEMLEAGWEAYVVPKEPLIKDAECREIMRLWADRCGVKTVILFGSEFTYGAKCICFGVDFGLEHLKRYTIAELCGEEEE